MKLHLPAKLFHAVLACLAAAAFSTSAHAAVPSGYRTITISNAGQLASYTDTDYAAFLISANLTDGSYRICGDHQYWSGTTSNTRTLTFASFDSETRGALCVENDLTMEKFKNLTFDQNVSHTGSNWDYMGFQGGAAVCGNYSSSMVFSDNTAVTFSRNSAEWDGGAVCGGDVDFRGNGTLTFTENSASCGGALYSGGYPLDDVPIPNGINIESNDVVDFSGNSARMGGAIFEDGVQALSIAGNGIVNFEGNRSEELGGAIAVYNFTGREVDVTVSGNNQVSFTGNVAGGNGGCIYHSDGRIALSKNSSLSFGGNSAGGNGGALYGSDIAVTGNGEVVFTGNASPGAASVPDVVTLNDFRKAKKEFHINTLGHISISPEANLPEAQGSLQDTVYCTGETEFFGAVYDCTFVYRTDELNHESGVPSMANLWITFQSLSAITDGSVLAAVGMDPQGSNMVGGALEMQFNFTTHEVEVLTSSQGTVTINYPDPMGEYLPFNAWLRSVLNGNFYVTKQGASLYLAGYGDLVNNGGGAVYVTENGNLLVEENNIVEFSNNNAANAGGAIFGENGSTITISGNPSVSFIQNTAGENGGAIAVYDNCLVSVTDNGSVVFDGNSAQQVGGAIYGGYGSTVSLHGNGEVSFLRNAPGAIYAENIGIEANDSVTFAENDQAGAIYGKSAIDIANNGFVSFSTNWSYENGGAICGWEWDTASISLRGNTSVEFSENASEQRGGAVYGSDIAITNNGSVVFSGNSAAGEQGYMPKQLTPDHLVMQGRTNSEIVIQGVSYPRIDGGLSVPGQMVITLPDTPLPDGPVNASFVSFGDNVVGVQLPAARAGEIAHSVNLTASFTETPVAQSNGNSMGDIQLQFVDTANGVHYQSWTPLTLKVTSSEYTCSEKIYEDYSGGEPSSTAGRWVQDYHVTYMGEVESGRIRVVSTQVTEGHPNGFVGMLDLTGRTFTWTCDETRVDAINPYDPYELKPFIAYLSATYSSATPLPYGGGAVYVPQGGSVRIEGNDHVEFRNNWIYSGDTYRLMGLCVEGDELVLAAGAGQDITFHDALYAKSANGALQVSFNADYRDKGNVLREATGDIVFSGKYAEQDLRALKRYYTQEELEASQTTEVYGTTNLYGGRLRIEDGAVYKGEGINAAGGSNATLRLAGGTLNQANHAVTLAGGTALELQGVNDITASTLNLQGGSRLSFVVGSENLNASCLYLDGDLVRSGKITLSLAGDGTLKAGNEYRLLTLGSGDTPSSWNWNYVTISGMSAGRDDFRWQEGTLYYTYTRAPEEIDFPAGGTWANGTGNYNDGDFVTFTNCGTVTVVGTVIPGGMTVQGGSGTTWSGSGTVAGAAGLTKTGSGTLTINTANTYSGGTTISGGTLRIGNKAALGTGAVQLSGGTLEVAASGFSNTISASANSAITVTSGNTLTLKNAISNTGTLTLKGEFNASALALSDGVTTHVDVKGKTGASGFSRTGGRSVTIVSGGTTIGRDATITHSGLKPGETLTLGSDGKATTGQGSVDYSTYLLTGMDTASVSDIEKAAKEHGATLNGITVPGGTLTVDATTDKVNVSGGEITLVEGGLLTVPKAGALEYSTVTLEGGTLNVNGKDISQCDVVATGPSTVEAGAGGKVRDLAVRTGGTSGQNGELYFADELTLGGTLNVGSFTLEQGDIVGDGTIKVTGSAVVRHGYVGCDLEGAMGAKLVKEGADTRVELGAQTTFTGGVTVKEGSLALLHGSGLSADVTVYNGAALLIDKKVKVAGDIALQGGATIRLRPGSAYTLNRELTAYGAEFRGSLSTASGASVTLGAGGAALTVSGNVTLGGGNIVYGSASATLAVDGTLTLQSNTSITGNWAVGGPYTIIQATSVETGNKNLNTFFNLAQTNYTLTATKTSITLQKKAGAKAAALQSLAGSTVPAMGGEAVEAPVTETLVQGVAETLVQADWGTVHAGRAFAGTLNGRHQSLRAICNGKSAVWVNAMGSRTRQSSAHGHAGADHDLYGGVFGVEFNAGAHGAAGLAIGHSWNRVNTFGMNRVKQDSQHAGAFARARLASQGANNLWLEASAAYGKTESRGALGAARERWTQNGCTLNLHANDVRQVSGESAVNFFAGLEYVATDSGTFDSLSSGSVQNLRGELGAGVTRTAGRGMVYAEAALLGDMVRHNPQADLGAGYRGANPGRIGGSISVGGAYAINAHWSVNASYTFEGVKHSNSHNAGVGATFRF